MAIFISGDVEEDVDYCHASDSELTACLPMTASVVRPFGATRPIAGIGYRERLVWPYSVEKFEISREANFRPMQI